ncbi:Ig-like domain-containing protein [Myroides odoratimimus]|uniref:Ig-like domain-containing protein n=1 Tax=Myroides odoratimimus TaxID=76832 RepID=UPI002578854F|nr:Ig-like domain-containing protein [Myroides odoratimimus]MDM1395619.1 Ig-like domain-containing protein [Myroides odoratimimus]
MKLKSILFVACSLFLFNCSSSDDNGGTPTKPSKIEFKTKEKQLLVNESFNLLDELILENVDTKTIQWTGYNDKIVNLSGTTIKATAKGETTLTAFVKNSDKKATLKLIVADVKVVFKQEKVEVHRGNTIDLNELLTLENVAKDELTWTLDNNDFAKIKDGVVTGFAKGEVNITAAATNKQVKATIKVVVKPAEISELHIVGLEGVLILNKKEQLKAAAYPQDAELTGLIWSSSNEKIVKVSPTGLAEPVALGSVFINVKSPNGKEQTIYVEVIGSDIMQIIILPKKADVVFGDKMELELLVDPPRYEPGMIVFTSSNPSIATVDEKGIVTTFVNKKGTVTITASSKKDPNINASTELNVMAPFDKITVSTTVSGLNYVDGAAHGHATLEIKENSIIPGFVNDNPNWFQITRVRVFSKDGKVIFENNKIVDTRYSSSRKYGFKLEGVHDPYIEYDLKFKDYKESKKETLVLKK